MVAACSWVCNTAALLRPQAQSPVFVKLLGRDAGGLLYVQAVGIVEIALGMRVAVRIPEVVPLVVAVHRRILRGRVIDKAAGRCVRALQLLSAQVFVSEYSALVYNMEW